MNPSAQNVDRPPKGGRSTLKRQETIAALAFISPWILGFLIFTAGPMAISLYLSLTEYDIINAPRFVGLTNYELLLRDARFSLSLTNSMIYAALHVPAMIVVALSLALILNQVGRAAGFFRTAFYLPSITPSVAVGTLWLWLLNPRVGLINAGLSLFGIEGPGWTTDPNWIKPGIVLMGLWSVGSTVIIYLAALRDVPEQLYEASSIDGASGWQQFRSITLPLISGAIFFTLIVNTIGALQVFAEVYTMFFGNMESSAASSAGLFYNIYLFRQAFEFLRMGYASSMAWVLFVIIMILTFIQIRVSRRFVYYEGGEQ
ncbi:MAG TPA: sugar ABC transporter permease [Aggregatilineales bacterium]|jgi:multiple sugar transport system permease protein|nr:sugar ABC transporter permease [Aggregatilineales bacterium]